MFVRINHMISLKYTQLFLAYVLEYAHYFWINLIKIYAVVFSIFFRICTLFLDDNVYEEIE